MGEGSAGGVCVRDWRVTIGHPLAFLLGPSFTEDPKEVGGDNKPTPARPRETCPQPAGTGKLWPARFENLSLGGWKTRPCNSRPSESDLMCVTRLSCLQACRIYTGVLCFFWGGGVVSCIASLH